jgi:hypothetical protein
MPHTPFEDRFIDVLQYMTGHELAQEISMPRKVRRLDAACRFGTAGLPGLFGALRPAFEGRVVLFEHESTPVSAEAVASAWVGQAWVSWQRLKKQQGRRQGVHRLVANTPRPPLAVVVADSVSGDLTGAVPTLEPATWQGLWTTSDTCDLRFNQGGLLVLDASRLPPGQGLSFWRWLGRVHDDADANARLLDLLNDDQLPMLDRIRFQEAIMDNQFNVSDTERETASQRVRREGREEGREEGERHALLTVAARFAPEALPGLRAIDDLDGLRRAVDLALARKLDS